MTTRTRFGIGFLMVLACVCSSHAQQPPGPSGPPPDGPFFPPSRLAGLQGAARQAGATPRQVQELDAALFERQMKQVDLKAAAEKVELELGHAMAAAGTDEKAVLKAVDAVNQARGELFKAEIAFQLNVKQIVGDALFAALPPPPPPAGPPPGDRARPQGEHGQPPQGDRPPPPHGERGPAPQAGLPQGERPPAPPSSVPQDR